MNGEPGSAGRTWRTWRCSRADIPLPDCGAGSGAGAGQRRLYRLPERLPPGRTRGFGQPAELLPGPVLCLDPRRRREQVPDRLARLRHRGVVAAARQQVPNREKPDGRCEARGGVAEVARRPHECCRISTVLGGALECHVEEPDILCRREPLTLLAAALGFATECWPRRDAGFWPTCCPSTCGLPGDPGGLEWIGKPRWICSSSFAGSMSSASGRWRAWRQSSGCIVGWCDRRWPTHCRQRGVTGSAPGPSWIRSPPSLIRFWRRICGHRAS